MTHFLLGTAFIGHVKAEIRIVMKKFVLLILFVFSCTLSSYAQFENGLQFRDSLAGWTARHAKISEIEPILKKYNIDSSGKRMIIKIDENNIFRIRCNVDSQDEIEWISMTTLYDSTDSGMKADIMVMTTLLENSKYLGLKFKEEAYFQMSSENNMFFVSEKLGITVVLTTCSMSRRYGCPTLEISFIKGTDYKKWIKQ